MPHPQGQSHLRKGVPHSGIVAELSLPAAASAFVSVLEGTTASSSADQQQRWPASSSTSSVQPAAASPVPPIHSPAGSNTPQSALPISSPGVTVTNTTTLTTTTASSATATALNSNNPFLNIDTAGVAAASAADPTILLLDQLEYQQAGRSRSYTVGASGPVRPVASKAGQGHLNVGQLAGIAQSIGDFTAFDISGQTNSVRYPWQKDVGVQCELLSDSSSTSIGGSRSLSSGSGELRSAGTQTSLSHLRDELLQVPHTQSHSVWRSGAMWPLKDRAGVHRMPPMPDPVSRKPLFGSEGRLTCAFNTCRRDSPAYAPLATEDNDSSPDESLWDEDR